MSSENEFLKSDIADTAFITNYYRSLDEELSRDPWAKLWVTDKARELGDSFAKEAVPHDYVNIQLRYRYFLEQLEIFQREVGEFCFLNIGAGFTTYPYQEFMVNHAISIEIDQPQVVSFKERTSLAYQKEGKLPNHKDLYYLGVNFEKDNYTDHLEKLLKDLKATNRPQFILMEGFFYYLSESVSNDLWKYLLSQLPEKSRIGMIYLPPETKDTTALQKTRDFLSRRCGYESDGIVYHPRSYFQSDILEELDHSDHVENEKRYLKTNHCTNDNTFNEAFLIMKKI